MSNAEVNAPETTLTWGRVARRPQWIVALILVMAVAAGFAWLGKWQLERAILNAQVVDHKTETVVDIGTLAQPAAYLTDAAAGHMVSTPMYLDRSTLMILSERYNDGEAGYWVIGRGATENGLLPIALGWSASLTDAQAFIASMKSEISTQVLTPVVGRLMPAEAPTEPKPDQNPQTMTTMAVAQLINMWPLSTSPTYFSYLVAKTPPAGLTAIVSTPPITDTSLNWLNIFYAIEWLVFALMAFYLWYRLVRDAKQREEDTERSKP